MELAKELREAFKKTDNSFSAYISYEQGDHFLNFTAYTPENEEREIRLYINCALTFNDVCKEIHDFYSRYNEAEEFEERKDEIGEEGYPATEEELRQDIKWFEDKLDELTDNLGPLFTSQKCALSAKGLSEYFGVIETELNKIEEAVSAFHEDYSAFRQYEKDGSPLRSGATFDDYEERFDKEVECAYDAIKYLYDKVIESGDCETSAELESAIERVEARLETISKCIEETALLMKQDKDASKNSLDWYLDEAEIDVYEYKYKVEGYDNDADRYYLYGACDYLDEAKDIAVRAMRRENERTDINREVTGMPDIDCAIISETENELPILRVGYPDKNGEVSIEEYQPEIER